MGLESMGASRALLRFKCHAAAVLVLLCAMPGYGLDLLPGASNFNKPAHFKVTADVVNKDVGAFTATVAGIGNSAFDQPSSFEPIIYRNKYRVTEDSADRVIATPNALSHYETLREGFLDGADVRIYRIANGKFSLVREDKIADGGFHVSGWTRAIKDEAVLAPNTTRFVYRWADFNRPLAKYYFTVRAINRDGKLSAPAAATNAERPEKLGKAEATNPIVDFKPSKSLIESAPPPAPGNLRSSVLADGTVQLEWNAVKSGDLAGYVVYLSDYPPEKQAGFYMQLAKKAENADQRVKTGDMVIVSKKFYKTSRKLRVSNRVWNAFGEYSVLLPSTVDFFPDETEGKTWELVKHGADTEVEEPGETYLKLDLSAGVTESLGQYNYSGTEQAYYQVLEKREYKVEVWLRRESGTGNVFFKVGPIFSRQIPPIKFEVGTQWQKFVATFTPDEVLTSAQPHRMALEFSGPGAFNVDNFRVYRADTGYLDYTQHQYDELKTSGMQALRTHGFVKTSFRTYDIEQLTNSGGVIGGRGRWGLNTLPQMFGVMRKAGVRPWLQLEFHLSAQEWLALIEFMAAPYDPKVDKPLRPVKNYFNTCGNGV